MKVKNIYIYKIKRLRKRKALDISDNKVTEGSLMLPRAATPHLPNAAASNAAPHVVVSANHKIPSIAAS